MWLLLCKKASNQYSYLFRICQASFQRSSQQAIGQPKLQKGSRSKQAIPTDCARNTQCNGYTSQQATSDRQASKSSPLMVAYTKLKVGRFSLWTKWILKDWQYLQVKRQHLESWRIPLLAMEKLFLWQEPGRQAASPGFSIQACPTSTTQNFCTQCGGRPCENQQESTVLVLVSNQILLQKISMLCLHF